MAKEIKQKIVLEGEKEYKQALKDAQRNLKTLQTQLKAETAELGKNATAQEKANVKTENLKKQIAEQEKVVKTLREALEQAKEQYGDNADVVARWEQQLNNARTTLANMKNGLDDVGTGMQNIETSAAAATVATKSVADSFDRLGSIGDTIASGIETAFEGLIGTVKEAIGYVWGEITDLAARSNGLVDMAGYWNTDVITLQKYKGAVEGTASSFEDLNSIVNKINLLDDKKIASLGLVSKEGYSDEWKYAMAVMDSLNQMDISERNSVAEQLFGKGNEAAKDLLNDWDTIQSKLDTYDPTKGGFGLTEDEMNQMSTLDEQISDIETKWKNLKDMGTVKLFGSLAMDLTGNANAILDAFLEYFNAKNPEEQDAAIKKIEDNIVAAFERIKKAIEDGIAILDKVAEDLKKSENPTANALGNILSGITEALKWLTEDNFANLKSCMEWLAAFWLAGEGASMAAKIAGIVANIAVIRGFNTASTATSAGAATSGGTIAAKVGAVLGGVGGFGLGAVGLTTAFAAWMTEQTRERDWGEYKRNEEVQEAMGEWTPDILEQLHRAVEGNDEGVDIESGLPQELLAQNLEEFKKLMPDSDVWGTIEEYGLGALNAEDVQETLKDVYNLLMDKYTNGDLTDTPASWWQTTGGNSGDGDTITSSDLQSFRNTPAAMESAVRKGVSNIKVTLDGRTVGSLVAPYVSQYIAETIV